MFLHNKHMETTGTLRYLNESNPSTSSGLRAVNNPTYTTGDCRFVVSDRNTHVRPNSDGLIHTDTLTVQFGWDQIKKLEDTGIQFTPERTSLFYDNREYTLYNADDFGKKYNDGYIPLGIIECRFEKVRERVNGSQ